MVQVKANQVGYDGEALREEGEVFEVADDRFDPKSSWYSPTDDAPKAKKSKAQIEAEAKRIEELKRAEGEALLASQTPNPSEYDPLAKGGPVDTSKG
jgi:hypothetical protein